MMITCLGLLSKLLASYMAAKAFRRIELGLPGFSRNTNPTVIPPQHILGQMKSTYHQHQQRKVD
jgi:hypothetical protein